MVRMLISTAIYVAANAIGLFVANLLLGGSFSFDLMGFIFATLLLSVVLALLGPLVTRLSKKNVPALQGGVALVTTFLGLWITNLIISGMHIAGVGTLLMATVLVWIGALIATIVLPMVLVKHKVDERRKG